MQNPLALLLKFRSLLATVFIVPLLSLYGFQGDSYSSNAWYNPQFSTFTFLAFVLTFGSYFFRNHFYSTAFFAAGTVFSFFLTVNAAVYANSDYSDFVNVGLGLAMVGVVFSLVSLFIGEGSVIAYIATSFKRIFTVGDHKVFSGVSQGVLIGLFIWVSFGLFNFYDDEHVSDFKFYIVFLVRVILYYFTLFTAVNALHFLISYNWSAIAGIFAKLDDTSLDVYVTRTISSWLYSVARWAAFVFLGYSFASSMHTYGDWQQLWLFPVVLPVIFLAGYLILMVVRIALESTNSIIHIAQNTSR